MLVLATLGALQRRLITTGRKRKAIAPQPEATPVTTTRVTVIDVGAPMQGPDDAQAWLQGVGEPELDAGLEVLNRALHVFRLVTASPYVNAVTREQALVARVGFGAGEQVADGQWTSALELAPASSRQSRVRTLTPQAHVAAVLAGREQALACQELVLRARLDLDHGRPREAALQLLVALDAALAELATDAAGPALGDRLQDLRGRREVVRQAAQAALAGPLDEQQRELVASTLARVEAALRARAVALG